VIPTVAGPNPWTAAYAALTGDPTWRGLRSVHVDNLARPQKGARVAWR